MNHGRKLVAGLLLLLSAFDAQLGSQQPHAEVVLEFDHVFILVEKDAPEATTLERLGLRPFGEPVRHTGQGTASIGYMFENAYVELLWVDDPAVLAAEDPLLSRRASWKRNGASPFGVGLRRAGVTSDTLPFPTRQRRAEWMRPGTAIYIAADTSNQMEPSFFVIPTYMAVPTFRPTMPDFADRTAHPLGARVLTRVSITMPRQELSSTSRWLAERAVLQLQTGQEHLLELELDRGAQGKVYDARPALPMLIRY